MLIALHDYIKKEGTVSAVHVARTFSLDLSALLPMLDFWVKKGVLSHTTPLKKCGGCHGCDENLPNIYQYVARTQCHEIKNALR